MINKWSMHMIDENNSKKIKNECWNEKVENYIANWYVNLKSFV